MDDDRDSCSFISDSVEVTRDVHGITVKGTWRGTANETDGEWWRNWECVSGSSGEIRNIFMELGIVYRDDFVTSGVTILRYDVRSGTVVWTIPGQPLCFGLRLVLVFTDRVFYRKDPDVYTDIPTILFSYTAGLTAAEHDCSIAEPHFEQRGVWKDIREKVTRFKSSSIEWNAFECNYHDTIESDHTNSCRLAYWKAADRTVEQMRLAAIEDELAAYHDKLSVAGNASEMLLATETYLNSGHVDVWSGFASCVENIERLRNMHVDFRGELLHVQDEERLLIAAAIAARSCREWRERVRGDIRDNAPDKWRAILNGLLLRVVEEESRDLYVLEESISASGVFLEYEADDIENEKLRKRLNDLSKWRRKTDFDKRQSAFIEKAQTFRDVTKSLLSWGVNDFTELVSYHENSRVRPNPSSTHDDISPENCLKQRLEYHARYGTYHETIGEAPLVRSGVSLGDYLKEFDGSDSTEGDGGKRKLKDVVVNRCQTLFSRLDYWFLCEEAKRGKFVDEINAVVQLTASLMGNLGNDCPTWTLPEDMHCDDDDHSLRTEALVDDYIRDLESFRRTFLRPSGLSYVPGETVVVGYDEIPAVFDILFVSSRVANTWSKQVSGQYREILREIRRAEVEYEKVIDSIVTVAREKNSLKAVYDKVIAKCCRGRPDVEQTEGDDETWWRILSDILVVKAPKLFDALSRVRNKDSFLRVVKECDESCKIQLNDSPPADPTAELSRLKELLYSHIEKTYKCDEVIGNSLRAATQRLRETREFLHNRTDDVLDDSCHVDFSIDGDSTTLFPQDLKHSSLELRQMLQNVIRMYEKRQVETELFRWIIDGRSRWMLSRTCLDDDASRRPISVASLILDVINVYDACHFSRHILSCLSDIVLEQLTSTAVVYGRTMKAWTTVTSQFDDRLGTSFDLWEKVPPALGYTFEDEEDDDDNDFSHRYRSPVAQSTTLDGCRLLQMAKLAVNLLKNVDVFTVDQRLLDECFWRTTQKALSWSSVRQTDLIDTDTIIETTENGELGYRTVSVVKFDDILNKCQHFQAFLRTHKERLCEVTGNIWDLESFDSPTTSFDEEILMESLKQIVIFDGDYDGDVDDDNAEAELEWEYEIVKHSGDDSDSPITSLVARLWPSVDPEETDREKLLCSVVDSTSTGPDVRLVHSDTRIEVAERDSRREDVGEDEDEYDDDNDDEEEDEEINTGMEATVHDKESGVEEEEEEEEEEVEEDCDDSGEERGAGRTESYCPKERFLIFATRDFYRHYTFEKELQDLRSSFSSLWVTERR